MPFLITTLAGFSTLIGFLFIYFKNTNNNVLISSLGFAGGVMFFISIFDLLPEAYNGLIGIYNPIFALFICLTFCVVGIIVSGLIDKLGRKNDDLYHVGIVSMIGIIIHNIPEGIATFLTSMVDLRLGFTLGIAITLHNIPEGISISVPIYYSTGSKKKAFFYTLISGLSELLGALIAYCFLREFDDDIYMSILYLIIAGIMLYISIYELVPTSLKYKNYFKTIISFVIGIIFIYISIILLK